MPTADNRIYNLAYGTEVRITCYPDEIQYTTDVKYNVLECERPYSKLFASTGLWYKRHGGLDMAGAWNAPIYAVADGTVIEAVIWGEPTGMYGASTSGTYVALLHDKCYGHTVVTVYKHFSSKNVKKGDNILKGQPLGKQGTTGNSTGQHLHFELWIDGKLYDPVPYLEERKSFIIAEPQEEPSVNIKVDARYKYIDTDNQNIRADKSVKSADIGDITPQSEFNVDIIADNEGYTWGHIPDVGWTVLYNGDVAWCVPVPKNDGSAEIARLNSVVTQKESTIVDLNKKITNARTALG